MAASFALLGALIGYQCCQRQPKYNRTSYLVNLNRPQTATQPLLAMVRVCRGDGCTHIDAIYQHQACSTQLLNSWHHNSTSLERIQSFPVSTQFNPAGLAAACQLASACRLTHARPFSYKLRAGILGPVLVFAVQASTAGPTAACPLQGWVPSNAVVKRAAGAIGCCAAVGRDCDTAVACIQQPQSTQVKQLLMCHTGCTALHRLALVRSHLLQHGAAAETFRFVTSMR
jgi:hypothetical protein